jgi:hypothetical protein
VNSYDYLDSDYRPSRASGILVESFGNESIAWGPGAHTPVFLDSTATLIFKVFDGEATAADLAEDLCEVFGLEQELAEAQIRRVVSLAAEGQLLDRASPDAEQWRVLRGLLPEPNW